MWSKNQYFLISGEIRIFSFEGWYCCFLSFFSPSFFTFVLLSHFCQRPDVHAPHVLFCIFLLSFLKNCCRTHFRRLIHVIGIFAWHFSPEIAHSTDWYKPQCLDNISGVLYFFDRTLNAYQGSWSETGYPQNSSEKQPESMFFGKLTILTQTLKSRKFKFS